MEITNYNEFILEKQVIGLLLESQVVFSKRLLDLLGSMPKNPILTKILSLQSKDLDVLQNFVDLGTAKDTVTFTPERKVKELLGNRTLIYVRNGEGGCLLHRESNQAIFSRLNYTYEEGTSHWNPSTGTKGVILSTTQNRDRDKTYALFECTEGDDKGKKTVINKNNLSEVDDTIEKIWKTNRNSIKIGRLVRALLTVLGEKPTDAQIEDFVNKFKASYDIMNDALSRFDVVSGRKIAYWYNCDHYCDDDDGGGTLSNSCMKEVDSNYFEIYVKNPDKCRLVIMYDTKGKVGEDGKYKSSRIVGRALLWNTDQGDTVMDRVYYTNDSDVDLFKRFAFHNNWIVRRGGTSWDSATGVVSKSFSISLGEWKFDEFPYVDTFYYFNYADGKLGNSKSMVDPNNTSSNDDDDDDYDDDGRPNRNIRVLSDTDGGWN